MPRSSRNILFLTTAFPNESNPFDGIFVFKHARALNKAGENIVVLTTEEENNKPASQTLIQETLQDVELYRTQYKPGIGALRLKRKVNALKNGFSALVASKKIDLVHVHFSYPSGFVAHWIKEEFGIPYVITEHSSMFNPYRKEVRFKMLRKLVKKVLDGAEYIMPVSDDLAVHMKSISNLAKYVTVPNVVNSNVFNLKNPQLGERIKVLHVSSLAEPKNIPGLLEIFKRMVTERPEMDFTIVGEASNTMLSAKLEELDIPNDRLQCVYGLQEEEVAEQMQKHDLFLLFSNYENLPCVLIEAQSCGLPIFSTDVGGIREIVDEKALGMLLPRGDVDGMVEALKNYSREHFNNKEIRMHALEKYSEKEVAKKYSKIYDAVLS